MYVHYFFILRIQARETGSVSIKVKKMDQFKKRPTHVGRKVNFWNPNFNWYPLKRGFPHLDNCQGRGYGRRRVKIFLGGKKKLGNCYKIKKCLFTSQIEWGATRYIECGLSHPRQSAFRQFLYFPSRFGLRLTWRWKSTTSQLQNFKLSFRIPKIQSDWKFFQYSKSEIIKTSNCRSSLILEKS